MSHFTYCKMHMACYGKLIDNVYILLTNSNCLRIFIKQILITTSSVWKMKGINIVGCMYLSDLLILGTCCLFLFLPALVTQGWSRVFLYRSIDVICLQCLQIRIPAAQCSHWSICPHSGWYTCLPVAYPTAAMAIMIQTMEIKHCELLEATLDAMCD